MSGIHLTLMRHGNTFGPGDIPVQVGLTSDLPLVEKGLAQAETAAQVMRHHQIPLTHIFAGQLKRQVETAKTVAKAYPDIEPTLGVTALDEIDYGAWEGMSPEAIKARWPEAHHAWETQAIWPDTLFKGQLNHHLKAISDWLDHLKQMSPGDHVFAVSSNGIIRLFLSFANIDWKQRVEQKTLAQLKVKTGHLCKLTLDETGLYVNYWNVNPETLLK